MLRVCVIGGCVVARLSKLLSTWLLVHRSSWRKMCAGLLRLRLEIADSVMSVHGLTRPVLLWILLYSDQRPAVWLQLLRRQWLG